ncbi:MAG: vanadium-dependent haloperoxidase, partial [Pseudomonadota bacterium]|nr:vanadium-dependent haloperoxidase [Pseudomonadota bacterium]
VLAATSCLPAHANVITDWSEKSAVAAYVMAGGPNNGGLRLVAMTHIAMFEAVNSIEPRYTPYRARLSADRSWSQEAAASAAAHGVMSKMLTDGARLKDIEALHAAVLARIPEGEAKTRGLELGARAAAAIIAERNGDGSDTVNDYRPVTAPGVYVPTQFPAAINWFKVRPFGMQRADQFRAPPPYALSSPAWARDFNEVKRLGGKSASARTEEQSRIAKFWEFIGPGTFNPIGVHLVREKKLDIVDSARALALMSIACFDAGVAVIDSKYTYNFWRPVTAIRNGDNDGNDATDRDDRWEPYIPTPMHPEYPCAHCTFAGAAATALTAIFGDEMPEAKLVSTSAPGTTRTFTRLSAYVQEVIDARIYDGVHYRASGDIGAEIGRRVGHYVTANYLTPAR